ncbi:MAG: TetR family transcriptional regulator [Haliea sp.]|uniref:TetR/AcrR family transcriptional regulator n=1 Tax=Haliea sp. TaxID=1932666 RepID=UPI000C53C194|nr:TetR/AcrR family transcriptional regulator [Haliea sp.]MBM68424.1 TetR family transcriptional regulator [Haliea sp.]|tara:strand:+ start:15223 stop:15840 length:618 start_codon:yes stop_codon:yes gene_type:complete
MNSRATAYHHGDLRNALILAAAELIEERGSADFAMVDAARRAGVSSAAPYRHFRDKTALLDAVIDFAFFALGEQVQTAVQTQPPGSAEAIIAIGKAYIRFMREHRAFYGLMWGDAGIRALQERPSDERSAAGFYVLMSAVEAWCAQNPVDERDVLQLSIKLWSMAHGLAGIALYGHVERFLPQADVFSLLESSTHTFLEGLRKRC